MPPRKKSTKKIQQGLGFLNSVEKDAELSAVDMLKSKGYLVSKVDFDSSDVDTVDKLISYFYTVMKKYHPDRKLHYTSAGELDREFCSRLVKSRQSTGISRARAYSESVRIINTLFKYEDILGLSSPITSMSTIGTSWIMDKVVKFLNNEDGIVEDMQYDGILRDVSSEIDTDEFQEKARKRLDEIYRKVVVDGKKKG